MAEVFAVPRPESRVAAENGQSYKRRVSRKAEEPHRANSSARLLSFRLKSRFRSDSEVAVAFRFKQILSELSAAFRKQDAT